MTATVRSGHGRGLTPDMSREATVPVGHGRGLTPDMSREAA